MFFNLTLNKTNISLTKLFFFIPNVTIIFKVKLFNIFYVIYSGFNLTLAPFGTKYSIMDQVKFVEDCL